jgi:poly(beta-D-mannuronate) lyase
VGSGFTSTCRAKRNRVDHCYLEGHAPADVKMQVEVDKTEPNEHRIDHNHFGPRPPLGKNGGETIRLGYSHQSMNNSRTVVEENLFEKCDGEIEIISSKSCENIYRGNTFRDSEGCLTLRHGNRCTIDGNYFSATAAQESRPAAFA